MLEQGLSGCELDQLAMSLYEASEGGRFYTESLRATVHESKFEIVSHITKIMELHQQKSFLLSEEDYFEALHEQYRHIGSLIGVIIGGERKTLLRASRTEEPANIMGDMFEGIMKGLSEDGKTLGQCYDRLMEGIDDVELIYEMIGNVMTGNGNIAMYSLLFTKLYGHYNAAQTDCRVHILAVRLLDFKTIQSKIVDIQPQITALATTLGMQFMMKNYKAVGM